MRKDPISEKTYFEAIQFIENTFNLKIRKVPLFNISKKELELFFPITQKFLLNFIKGFYFLRSDTIYIVDGNEEDIQSFIPEILHSNSIFNLENSNIWIYEGLTKAITEKIMKKQGLPIKIDYFIEQEKNFWIKKLQFNQRIIIRAYFSDTLSEGIKLLKKALKTEKNIIEISFNEFLKGN